MDVWQVSTGTSSGLELWWRCKWTFAPLRRCGGLTLTEKEPLSTATRGSAGRSWGRRAGAAAAWRDWGPQYPNGPPGNKDDRGREPPGYSSPCWEREGKNKYHDASCVSQTVRVTRRLPWWSQLVNCQLVVDAYANRKFHLDIIMLSGAFKGSVNNIWPDIYCFLIGKVIIIYCP